MPDLFQIGDFTLASGAKSRWKIECDALSPHDWAGLAAMAMQFLPAFGRVAGVPRGGLPFADALRRHATPGSPLVLVAEDVCTTGGSISRYAQIVLNETPGLVAGRILGVCVFARDRYPHWVTPLFRMPGACTTPDAGE